MKNYSASELCEEAATLVFEGYQMAFRWVDDASLPAPGSPLHNLHSRIGQLSPGDWPTEVIHWLSETLRARVGVSGSQLYGIGTLFSSGPPILLHPLVTLIRGIAETCGRILWLIRPWLNESSEEVEADLKETTWDELAIRVLARVELSRLEALWDRRRRLVASHNVEHELVQSATSSYASYRTALQARHQNSKLDGQIRTWKLHGEKIPTNTTLVTGVTEYAYGQSALGSGRNPYPMYSGYAHGSIETVFASAGPNRPPITSLMYADDVEIRRLAGIALRTFAAGFEMAASSFGSELGALRRWEDQVNVLVVEPNDSEAL
jgi:hypothetical protein